MHDTRRTRVQHIKQRGGDPKKVTMHKSDQTVKAYAQGAEPDFEWDSSSGEEDEEDTAGKDDDATPEELHETSATGNSPTPAQN